MKNLIIRSVTGVVFVFVTLGAMVLGEVTYGIFLALIAAGCMWEFFVIARGIGRTDAAEKAARKGLEPVAAASSGISKTGLIGMAYIAFCFWLMWFFPLFGWGMSGAQPGFWDVRIAPAFAVIVWSNDVFAYLAGITLGKNGRHKLCERISPLKTWEGFAGGVVGAVLTATILAMFLFEAKGVQLVIWVGFGFVIALASVVGDLAESYFKRRAGVKDSGFLLPGHGGLLDRFDAMLGAIPVAFVYMVLMLFTR